MIVSIEKHTQTDKDFAIEVGNDLYLRADYDDVDHDSVDAMAECVKRILEEHWNNEMFHSKLTEIKSKKRSN